MLGKVEKADSQLVGNKGRGLSGARVIWCLANNMNEMKNTIIAITPIVEKIFSC